MWDHDFEYRMDVTLRPDCLEWDLIVINLGDKPFDITLGMHTYFDVSSVKNIVINGPFSGATALDKVSGAESKMGSNDIKVDKFMDVLYKVSYFPPHFLHIVSDSLCIVFAKFYLFLPYALFLYCGTFLHFSGCQRSHHNHRLWQRHQNHHGAERFRRLLRLVSLRYVLNKSYFQ